MRVYMYMYIYICTYIHIDTSTYKYIYLQAINIAGQAHNVALLRIEHSRQAPNIVIFKVQHAIQFVLAVALFALVFYFVQILYMVNMLKTFTYMCVYL